MVSLRFLAFAVFFHAVVATPLYIPANMPSISRRQDVTTTSDVPGPTKTLITFGLPDSARLGSPVLECEDAVAGFCE
ncbi:hypothetical protein ACEPAH_8008 [Sanghuangporus vaninii]